MSLTRKEIVTEILEKGKVIHTEDTDWYLFKVYEGTLSDNRLYRVEFSKCKLALDVTYCFVIRINPNDRDDEHYLGMQRMERIEF